MSSEKQIKANQKKGLLPAGPLTAENLQIVDSNTIWFRND